jgi:hypothetical protein
MDSLETVIKKVVTPENIFDYQNNHNFGLMKSLIKEVSDIIGENYESEVIFGAVMKALQNNWDIPNENKYKIKQLTEENEKLKSALKEISEYTHTMKSYQRIISDLKWIANKALGKN